MTTKSVKLPKVSYQSLQLLQTEMIVHGTKALPRWMQDLVISSRGITKEDLLETAIVSLALIAIGKTKEEISQMSKDEVIKLLQENRYPLPPKW